MLRSESFHDLHPAQLRRLTGYRLRGVAGRLDGGSTLSARTKRFADLLEKMQLGLYHLDGTRYLLGALDENIPDHDRWLYMLEPKSRLMSSENLVLELLPEIAHRDGMLTAATVISAKASGGRLGDLMLDLEETFALWEVCATGQLTGPGGNHPWREISPGKFMVALRYFGLYPRRNMDDLWRVVNNLTEVHDMICTAGGWDEQHPEFAELPRDLILRAHGYGRLCEAEYWD